MKLDENKSVSKYEMAIHWSKVFGQAISEESPRAMIILSVCYLDECLNQLLKAIFVPVDSKSDLLFDGPSAPLGTYFAKVELAYRMRLFDDEMRDSLNLIRKIRNEFAHDLGTNSFSNESVLRKNQKLYELNKSAMKEGRNAFPEGEIGNFQAVASLMIFMLRVLIERVPSKCSVCGLPIAHIGQLKQMVPGGHEQ